MFSSLRRLPNVYRSWILGKRYMAGLGDRWSSFIKKIGIERGRQPKQEICIQKFCNLLIFFVSVYIFRLSQWVRMSLHTPSSVFTTWRSTPFSFASVSIHNAKNHVHLVNYLHYNNSNLIISLCCLSGDSKSKLL